MVTETTFQCVLVVALMQGYDKEVVDIETSFLYGTLDKKIFMKVPKGLEIYLESNFDHEYCLMSDKAIYWLVQAAR